jgi:hypothetical protein
LEWRHRSVHVSASVGYWLVRSNSALLNGGLRSIAGRRPCFGWLAQSSLTACARTCADETVPITFCGAPRSSDGIAHLHPGIRWDDYIHHGSERAATGPDTASIGFSGHKMASRSRCHACPTSHRCVGFPTGPVDKILGKTPLRWTTQNASGRIGGFELSGGSNATRDQ